MANGAASVYTFTSDDFPGFPFGSGEPLKDTDTGLILSSETKFLAPFHSWHGQPGQYSKVSYSGSDPNLALAFQLTERLYELGDPWQVKSLVAPYGISPADYVKALAKRFNLHLFADDSNGDALCMELMSKFAGAVPSQMAYIFICYALIEKLYFSSDLFDAAWLLAQLKKEHSLPTLKQYFIHRNALTNIHPTVNQLMSLICWYGIDIIPGLEDWLNEKGYSGVPKLGITWERIIIETSQQQVDVVEFVEQISKLPKDTVTQLYS